MIAKEEMKRIRGERPGFHADGTPIQISTLKKTQVVADKVVGVAVGNTVGRVLKFANRRLLGRIPEEALKGSFTSENDNVSTTTISSDTKTIEVSNEIRINPEIENVNYEMERSNSVSESFAEERESLEREIADQVFLEQPKVVERS
jgi:hypothetical protein